MNRAIISSSLAVAVAAFAVAIPASAQAQQQQQPQQQTPQQQQQQQQPAPAAPAPVAAEDDASTTTTTSAAPGVSTQSTSDATAGPSAPNASESRDDVVTVTRSIRPNRPWLITGGIILAGSYVTTAVVNSSEGRTVEDRNLYIPIAGPWLNLADRQCDGCENETRNIAMVIGSGVLQGAGAIMVAASFFIPEKIDAATIQAGPVKLHVAPAQYGRGGMGLGALGTF